jgi:hypothetical protein
MSLFAQLLRRRARAPLVSVVVASYNHAPFVQDCLRSALSQGIDDLEILVTDDGSTDATAQHVAALGDPRIHLHAFEQNRGACLAMNDALRRSRGRYIAVLNSDDLFLPGKLRRQIDFLEHNPQVGAVFGWPSFIDEQGQPFHDPAHKDHAVFHQPNRGRHQWLRHFFDQGNALCHPTALLRREVYQNVGLYDPRLAQVPDLDQWIRVCMRYDIHVLPEPLTAFRIRSGQQNASGARPEVVRRVATMPSDVPLKAGLQVLADLLQPEGMQMVRDELARQERLTVDSRRAVFSAALAKYALPDQIEQEIALPGWTQDLVDQISDLYDEDVAQIAALPGVEFITP